MQQFIHINEKILSCHNRRLNDIVDLPQLDHGIKESLAGIGSLYPAVKPREVEKSDLACDCDTIQKITAKIIFTSILFLNSTLHANTPPSCTSDNSMLAIIDRPSVGSSPCTVPNKTLYIESGYIYQLLTPSGFSYNLPQTELRFGIMNNTEIEFFPPDYYELNAPPLKGYGTTSLGLKHVLLYDSHQMVTLQGYVTPPSGSQNFGSLNTGFVVNGIYGYNFDSGIGVALTLGVVANTAPPSAPAHNFYTFNPIIDIGLPITERLGAYIEVYSQSKTALNQGWGVSMDGGLIVLADKNISLDLSAGQRISGTLGGVDHYFEAGFVVALDL